MKTISPVAWLTHRVRRIAVMLCLTGSLAATPGAFATEAKTSEIMEQGVYSEETKGDLDAAIHFYQQVVAEADAGQSLGAQAFNSPARQPPPVHTTALLPT
jgi:hypothetical protein